MGRSWNSFPKNDNKGTDITEEKLECIVLVGLPIVLVKCTAGIDDTSLPPNLNNDDNIYFQISPGVGAVIECEFKAVLYYETFWDIGTRGMLCIVCW
jgi:hypothetical protein